MKKLVLFTLLAIISQPSLLSQSIEEDITHWKEVINELNQRKQVLSDSIDIINDLINRLVFEKSIDDEGAFSFDVQIGLNGKILDEPSPFGEVLAHVKKGQKITIFKDAGNGYWSCRRGESVGYINEVYFIMTDEIKNFISASKALEAKSEVERVEQNRASKQKELEEKFGAVDARRIASGKYWIGMTAEMARLSLGSPDDINRSVGSFGVHEQWVYQKRDLYLYFEGGKLTSWQD